MKFRSLNPQMVQTGDHHSLTFDCPGCKMRISINVRIGEQPDKKRRLWMLILDFDVRDWDTATVIPSIKDHMRGRNWPECSAHISITEGDVENQ